MNVSISLTGFYGSTKGLRVTLGDNTTKTTITLDASGNATWTWTATVAGPTTLTASIGEDPNNEATGGRVDITVTKASPTLQLAADPTALKVGGKVKVNLTLSGYFGPTKGLKLILSDGSYATLDAIGKATWNFPTTAAGPIKLRASSEGSPSNLRAEGSVVVTVLKATPTMTLKAEPTKATIGGKVRKSRVAPVVLPSASLQALNPRFAVGWSGHSLYHPLRPLWLA